VTVHGNQRLVRGDHVLAVVDRLEYQLLGDGVATDQLDDDVDFRVVDQSEDVCGDLGTGGIAARVRIACGDLGHFDAATGATRDLFGVALEHIEGAAADGSQSTDTYFHRFQAQLPITAGAPGSTGRKEKSRTLR